MLIRMIEGQYEDIVQTYLSPVAFPMEEVYYEGDMDHPDYVKINDEDELKAWADTAFYSYEIYNMEVPEGAIVKESQPA